MDAAIEMPLDLESDPPNAGRALLKQFEQDYLGTLQRLMRLEAADQLLLACAYVAYCGGNPDRTLETWKASAANMESASAAFLHVWGGDRDYAILILSQMSSAERAGAIQGLPTAEWETAWNAAIEYRRASLHESSPLRGECTTGARNIEEK